MLRVLLLMKTLENGRYDVQKLMTKSNAEFEHITMVRSSMEVVSGKTTDFSFSTIDMAF